MVDTHTKKSILSSQDYNKLEEANNCLLKDGKSWIAKESMVGRGKLEGI